VGNDHWHSTFIQVMCIQAPLSDAIEQTRPDWRGSLRGAKVQAVKQVNWCEEQRGVGHLSCWICGTVQYFHGKKQSLWPNKCNFWDAQVPFGCLFTSFSSSHSIS